MLALAKDDAASENETEVAMAAAHRLMQKHRIKEVELGQVDSDFEIMDKDLAWLGSRATQWKGYLAKTVATHNGCYVWVSDRDGNHFIQVAGRPEDAAIVYELYRFCVRQIMAMSTMHKGRGARFLNAWRMGVIFTIDRRLRVVTEELAQGSTALVVINNRADEAAKFIQDQIKLRRPKANKRPLDTDGYLRGCHDGEQIRLNKELE